MSTRDSVTRALDDLRRAIRDSKPTIRADYIVGFYRVWCRLPAIERALIRRGLVSKEEIDAEMTRLLKEAMDDFK